MGEFLIAERAAAGLEGTKNVEAAGEHRDEAAARSAIGRPLLHRHNAARHIAILSVNSA